MKPLIRILIGLLALVLCLGAAGAEEETVNFSDDAAISCS